MNNFSILELQVYFFKAAGLSSLDDYVCIFS